MWKVCGPKKEVQGDLEVALFAYDLLSRAPLNDLERSGLSRFGSEGNPLGRGEEDFGSDPNP